MNTYDLPTWSHPKDYMGLSPDGDFVLCTQNRDSSILEQSNFAVFQKLMDDKEIECGNDTDEAYVYTFSANHWAVGWVEYLMLSANAPESLQLCAYETLAAIENYPVLDEMDYSQRQYDAIYDYWEQMSTQDRIELCADNNVSIFAARHDQIHETVFYRLCDSIY